MENASKALLIAGAILICILLIGVGMMVFNGARDGIDEAILNMSAQQKDMFNQNFSRYVGERVTGTNVRALLQNIISSNTTNKDISGKLVAIEAPSDLGGTITPAEGDAKANEISQMRTKVNTGKTYKVTANYNSDTGLIDKIKIENAEKSST
ncbi:MAG: hypothetical protein HFJ27_06455 [Clostridia bacterium]|nr:hypothetical protein [Clostridia bacterium]